MPATSPNLGQWLAGQPDRFEVWTQPGVAGRRPTTIAELEGQNRRPDLTRGNGSIAVIYPDLGEPYRSVFSEIIAGIEEQASTSVRSYPIAFSADVAELNRQLKRNGNRVVIALGRQGLKAASGLDRDIAVVVGGVLSVPEQESHDLMGISLTPDA